MLNPTRKDLLANNKKDLKIGIWIYLIMFIGIFSFLFYFTNWKVALIASSVIGFIMALILWESTWISEGQERELGLYTYFEGRSEKVEKFDSIGTTTGKGLFISGPYTEVKTDKGHYIVQMKANEVISIMDKNQTSSLHEYSN
jgi:hypothetical protein